ncbi:MAG: class I SAM-dependent methyltransferase [Lentisphaeria bacterium]|jgi:SAM-dependent methyltransferase
MWIDREFIDPFMQEDPCFWVKIEHLGRYLFAKDRINQISNGTCTVADFGCANGYGSAILAQAARQVDAFDVNGDYLAEARTRHHARNIRYQQFDANDLSAEPPCAPNRYDVAVAFEILEHLDHPEALLRLLARAIKPGGTLLLSVPNPRYERSDSDGASSNPYHRHIFTRDDIKAMLSAHGFTLKRSLGQGLCNILSIREAKLVTKKRFELSTAKNPLFQDPAVISQFAYLVAYPDDVAINESYSYLFEAEKSAADDLRDNAPN